MEKIVTVTLNPAIDKSTTVGAIVPEKKLRCARPVYEPGGGGVNVSRAMKKLGYDSKAVYLAGGHSGKFFTNLLDEEEIRSHVITIEGHTRENLIVVDESTNLQYRFGMPGPKIQESEWQQCLDVVSGFAGVKYIVASGSVPEGVPEDFFGRLAAVSKRIGARLIVDTSGEPLRHAMKEGLFMLKPNLGELSNLHGVEELQEDDVLDAARDIIDKGGCEVMVISMGASGALLVTKAEALFSPSPTVKRRSTVGAGDSMVAGIVIALSKGSSWMEALHYGIAAGTATTMNSGTELCRKEDVEKLYACLKAKKDVISYQ